MNEQKKEVLPTGGILSTFCVFPYDVLQVVLFGGLRKNSKKFLERSSNLWTLDTGFTNETEKIGKYDIVSILGSGCNSTVYCVKYAESNTTINLALKRIRLFQQDTNLNQYTVLTDLKHENILTVNQKNFENKNGLNGKVTYLQMIEPYCELGNLTKYLTNSKNIPKRFKKIISEEV
jgi:serine/threonine protein kinase